MTDAARTNSRLTLPFTPSSLARYIFRALARDVSTNAFCAFFRARDKFHDELHKSSRDESIECYRADIRFNLDPSFHI